MKKIFLIAGLVAGFATTNGYAVGSQTVKVTYTCPAGCEIGTVQNQNGTTQVYCYIPNTTERCADPTVNILNYAIGPTDVEVQEVTPVKLNNTNTKKSNKVSVRAAKVARVKPVSTKPQAQDMAADGGAIAINCPAGCTPDCAILGNTVLCECKASDGSTCKAEVVVADDATVVK